MIDDNESKKFEDVLPQVYVSKDDNVWGYVGWLCVCIWIIAFDSSPKAKLVSQLLHWQSPYENDTLSARLRIHCLSCRGDKTPHL